MYGRVAVSGEVALLDVLWALFDGVVVGLCWVGTRGVEGDAVGLEVPFSVSERFELQERM